jgi:uncharacterized protein with GYD domain
MPKYLFEARYSPEGAIGLAKEGGTGRRDAVKKHLEDVGGKLESMYFPFGEVDCFVIVDLPDNVSAAALSRRQRERSDREQGDRAVNARGNGQSGQDKGPL